MTKPQAPMTNSQFPRKGAFRIGYWCLGIGHLLVIGAWSLVIHGRVCASRLANALQVPRPQRRPAVGRVGGELADQLAVLDDRDLLGVSRDGRLVGDHYDRLA